MSAAAEIVTSHHQVVDTYAPKKILMVVANSSVNPKLGWNLGFWAAELAHPYLEFTEYGHNVTIASPSGGKVEVDALSDPRDPSKWSADDLVSMGFLSPRNAPICLNVPRL